jgi:hypothetical protein
MVEQTITEAGADEFKAHNYNPFVRVTWLNEYMLGSVFFKHRFMLSRTARLTILWTSLFGELILIGVFMLVTDIPTEIEYAVMPIIACTVMLPAGPLFNMFFKIDQKHLP